MHMGCGEWEEVLVRAVLHVHAHTCMRKGHSTDSNRQRPDIGLCCYEICMYRGEYCRVAIVV